MTALIILAGIVAMVPASMFASAWYEEINHGGWK